MNARRFRMAASAVLLAAATALPVAHAQIYNWSTGQVIPGTEGITPGPGMNLSYWNTDPHNLRYADLSGGLDLTGSQFYECWFDHAWFMGANLRNAFISTSSLANANMAGADATYAWLEGITFANANLNGTDFTNAWFDYVDLTNADLSGAVIAPAEFANPVGFTAAQLYSTASYASGNLRGLSLWTADLSNWNFANQDLTNAHLTAALTNANFTGADLTYASLYGMLDGASFDDATVRGMDLRGATTRGFTAAQLYSTASYEVADLRGIDLKGNDMTGWNLANQDLSGARLSSSFSFPDNRSIMDNADLSGANLTNAELIVAMLTGADLSGANLTNAYLSSATLTGADLSGAIVAGASFTHTTNHGFTKAQLYSTASYQAGDLHGIWLNGNNLTGWNLANQNLPEAHFDFATLTNADLSGANLTNAYLGYATLTGADLSGATVFGADFSSTTSRGFTEEQLYSTTSYQAGDLHGIGLAFNDLSGWDLANQNLTGASFASATLTGADLSGADTRGAWNLTAAQIASAITDDLILPDGHIAGLNLSAGETLKVRDYDGGIAITIDDEFQMDAGSTLAIIFGDNTWGSSISLADGVFADLDGTLALTFAPGTDVGSLLGVTFDLFNWNGGLLPGDGFANVTWPSGFDWALSDLYVGGNVTLTAVPEPATALLLSLAALAFRGRRQRGMSLRTTRSSIPRNG